MDQEELWKKMSKSLTRHANHRFSTKIHFIKAKKVEVASQRVYFDSDRTKEAMFEFQDQFTPSKNQNKLILQDTAESNKIITDNRYEHLERLQKSKLINKKPRINLSRNRFNLKIHYRKSR